MDHLVVNLMAKAIVWGLGGRVLTSADSPPTSLQKMGGFYSSSNVAGFCEDSVGNCTEKPFAACEMHKNQLDDGGSCLPQREGCFGFDIRFYTVVQNGRMTFNWQHSSCLALQNAGITSVSQCTRLSEVFFFFLNPGWYCIDKNSFSLLGLRIKVQNYNFKNFNVFTCMGVLFACIRVYHVYAQCIQKPEEGFGSPATGITVGCKPPCGCCNETRVVTLEQSVSAFNH